MQAGRLLAHTPPLVLRQFCRVLPWRFVIRAPARPIVQSSTAPCKQGSSRHPTPLPQSSHTSPTTVPQSSHNQPLETSRQLLANLSYPSLDPWRLTHPTVADHAGLRGCDRRSASESRCALAQASPASNPRMGWSTGPMPTILPTTYPTTALPVCGSGSLSRKRGRVRPWTRSACSAHG